MFVPHRRFPRLGDDSQTNKKGRPMQKLSVARWCQVLGFSALVAGCAGAEWQQVTVSPTYQPPKQVKVALASQSPTQNSDQAMQALQEAMADTFASKGITATFV